MSIQTTRYQAFIDNFSFSLENDHDPITFKKKSHQQRCMEIIARCLSYIPILPSIFIFCEKKPGQRLHNVARFLGVSDVHPYERTALKVRVLFLSIGCGLLLLPVDIVGTIIKIYDRNKKKARLREELLDCALL